MDTVEPSLADAWGLTGHEKEWVEVQPYLLSRGYQLRPRYCQGWKPPWSDGASLSEVMGREDLIDMHPGGIVLDATRVVDGETVAIKKTPKGTPEVQIGRFFSSEELRFKPENHCVPILDTFPDPRGNDFVFVVMPLLRRWDDPPVKTVGEMMNVIQQLLEGLSFMHSHNVAHRDVAGPNFMMDATLMYPEGFHPAAQYLAKDYPQTRYAKALSRTEAPPKYYFIDFGISTQFPDAASRSPVLGLPGRARAPELSATVPYDPFPVDIFGLGRFISNQIEEWRGLDSLRQLADTMTQNSPESRPSAEEALLEFQRIYHSLGRLHLSKRLFSRKQGLLQRVGLTIYDTIGLSGLTAIGVAAILGYRFRSSIIRK